MDKIKISIIITSNYDISAVFSLLKQNNINWECFIINNSVKNIEKYIINDTRFKILNGKDYCNVIHDAIKSSIGQYIMFIDSSDILLNDAISHILHMIDFTNADIIKYKLKLLSENTPEPSERRCIFEYVFKKNIIMDYIFNNLSEFCFKKDIVVDTYKNENEHAFLTDALLKSKDMALTKQTYILKQTNSNLLVKDIIDNYEKNHNKISNQFWKQYFKKLTPQIVSFSVKNNDKKSFITFCQKIPLRFIPLRYRIICYILKKTNK